MDLLATSSWLISIRDSSLAVAAVAGAILTVAAASKLPGFRRPIMWIWHQLTEDAVDAYWSRHAHVATTAIEPRLVDVGERIGELGARISTQGNQIHALARRLDHIESSCDAIPHIEEATDAIARHTDTDRRKNDR